MEIRLISVPKEDLPQCGFFIEGMNVEYWLTVLDDLALDPDRLELFPLPSNTANVLWGCLVLVSEAFLPSNTDPHSGAFHISNRLIIPEKTAITPNLTSFDIQHLFESDRYVLHMDFGLFKLTEPLNLSDYITMAKLDTADTSRPIAHVEVSPTISSFRIEATPLEDIKAELEAKPIRESLKDKPLSIGEKAKLALYEQLLKVSKSKNGKVDIQNTSTSTIDKLAKLLGFDGPQMKERMIRDYELLKERNRKEVEKLMDMLENDPELGLRYAIPLDDHGYSRGKEQFDFRMQKRGGTFSLFDRSWNTKGGGVTLGEEYHKLQQQYRKTAAVLEGKGDYEKAAFVYLKLLKDYGMAAETLRKGRFYEKAAFTYLQYLKNEISAAACYEEGKVYGKAIELYERNGNLEKVGDLYTLLGKRQKANTAFQKVVDQFVERSEYKKASFLCRDKLYDLDQCQLLLLEGWKKRRRAVECLVAYFGNIDDEDFAWEQIKYVRDHLTNKTNVAEFLQVVKKEYRVRDIHKPKLRDVGYTLISELLDKGMNCSSELLAFNEKDSRLLADTMKYKMSRKRRTAKPKAR